MIAVFGPTGIGKTDIAIALAQRLRNKGEDPVAVSADALQVYRGLEILTGAATRQQHARLEHRLVSFHPLTQTFSAGAYAALAHAEIDALLATGQRPIVVGGTGLYLRAALADLELRRPPDPAVRARWQAELESGGAPALHAVLAERDPDAAAGVEPNDGHRIVRLLELIESGIEPPPAPGADSQLWTGETRHPTLLFGLVMERDALAQRIEGRVRATVEAGAIDEVRRADAAGASVTARKALGFEELLRGDVDAMLLATRQYARRQLTWMRKLSGVRTLDVTGRSAADVAAELHGMIREA